MAVPKTQMPRRTRATNRDEEFMKRRRETFRGAAATLGRTLPLDLGGAIDPAMTPWPDYKDLLGMESDVTLLQHVISIT